MTTAPVPADPPGPSWHALPPHEAVARLRAHEERGLAEDEAERRLAAHGLNEIETGESFSWPAAAVRQLIDPLVLVLLAAAAISAAVGETLDAAAIAAIVLLNGVVSFLQEWRAERALAALSAVLAPTARVVRDGRTREIPAARIAPGDLVTLASGDKAPADLKLTSAADLSVDESALTGESEPVGKAAGADPQDAPLAGRASLVYAGSIVAAGRGRGVAVATGSATELSRIAALAAAVQRPETPLQRRLARLGRLLGLLALGVGALIVGAGLVSGRPWLEMFMTGVSLAVAAVPEGLPAVVALSLALGVRAMARRNALIRRLRAAETLGSATVICTDKTGTLTTGAMTAAVLATASGALRAPFRATGALDAEAACALETAAICNDASFDERGRAVGSPTEAALLSAARAAGVDAARAAPRVREAPFSSARKIMSVVVERRGALESHVKGAPERVIPLCTHERRGGARENLDEAASRAWVGRVRDMARSGLRVIALARREGLSAAEEAEDGLELLGLAGLHDPPRAGAPEAVETARTAGVRVLMITGDGPDTAAAIAREVGLEDGEVLGGADLGTLESEALASRLDGVTVLSRATPEHKLRIVEALQGRGEIVAMTGDGVNDAPALEKADIGVAMGIRGTDAAKASADMVLLDDDFATIVEAMREGRRQDDNIRKFVAFLLAANLGEVIAVASSILLGAPAMLLPVQILWMNLVTDGATALALGLERAEPRVMDRPPRPPGRPVLDRGMLGLVVLSGLALAIPAIVLFHAALASGLGAPTARSVAFTALVVLQQGMVLGFRSLDAPNGRLGWLSSPWLWGAIGLAVALQLAALHLWPLDRALHTEPLPGWAWTAIAGLAALLVAVPEAVKIVRERIAGNDSLSPARRRV